MKEDFAALIGDILKVSFVETKEANTFCGALLWHTHMFLLSETTRTYTTSPDWIRQVVARFVSSMIEQRWYKSLHQLAIVKAALERLRYVHCRWWRIRVGSISGDDIAEVHSALARIGQASSGCLYDDERRRWKPVVLQFEKI